MRKILFFGALAVAATLVLGACSSSDTPPGHNADDVTFAQQMIAHHTQALEMAKLAPSRSTNPKVLDLATRIEQAQDPEIKQLQGWLTTWAATPDMPGMNHGTTPGMMPTEDMAKLEAAKGTEFDRMWLAMMIDHHQGAIDMAKTELTKGGSTDAKALAQKIVDAQQAEITEMRGLLQS
ncbi:DUF305 domain-containing protein [Amycolatopsis tolypomycina]|uniref:DUF305 domain-containing protein n=1 Tax=Amycolatopsis tolypomycina TaxID=208445 RepID=UPI0033BBC527